METVRFTVPGAPKGKARARTVRGRGGNSFSYTPEQTVLYENLIKCCYRQEASGMIFNDGQPLKVTIIAYYPIVKSTSKKKKQQMLDDLMFPTKKPDIDNIAKSILDALNKLAYRDDTQVVTLHMEKHYADEPRVEVEIEEIKYEKENRFGQTEKTRHRLFFFGLRFLFGQEDKDLEIQIWSRRDHNFHLSSL